MRVRLLALLLALGLTPFAAAEEQPMVPPPWWTAETWQTQQARERSLIAAVDAEEHAALHAAVSADPHPAGTAADARMIELLSAQFRARGIEPVVHEIWPYLPHFKSASLKLDAEGRVHDLPLRERAVGEIGPAFEARHVGLTPAWNAYSGSGSVTGQVVYANYGTREDFKRLAALGVSVKDKIVVARYGRNYRGYKAKFAEAAGAAGLIMYTDPADSGWGRGVTWPEGGWANETSIQRGSIKTLPYAGDPLTPGRPATQDAARLDPATLALPKIPVQCVSWSAAEPILSRMRGRDVPKGWQGGLPFRYRVTQGDASFTVRLTVEQERKVTKTANVLGMVKGAVHPEQWIVIGCHFDAWTYGAGDPHAGTTILYALAAAFQKEAAAGRPPARTLVFANWGAEEMGIIGSTEWVEAHAAHLAQHGIAYLNLDMAAMGTRFRCSADPMLHEVMTQATRAVRQEADEPGSVFDAWTKGTAGVPRFGVLGGGSDHVGFYLHAGIPSVSIGAGGAQGVSYHSAHDNLRWYRRVVGEDYAGARMLSRVAAVFLSRMANAPIIPYSPRRVIERGAAALDTLADENAAEAGFTTPAGMPTDAAWRRAQQRLPKRAASDPAFAQATSTALVRAARAWLREEGLPGRPWYRNTYASTDPFSGYAAWTWPAFRLAFDAGDESGVTRAQQTCDACAKAFVAALRALVDLDSE